MSRTVYLAGPEVFLPNAPEIGQAKRAICREYGLGAVFPFEPFEPDAASPADTGHRIFVRCVELMDRCDIVIANMTPFRGVSMDVGTAVEIGYMFARGRKVFGYTNVMGDYDTRVRDDQQQTIEAFGFTDNLMVEGPVWYSGSAVIRIGVRENELLTDLRGFRRCVEEAVELLDEQAPGR